MKNKDTHKAIYNAFKLLEEKSVVYHMAVKEFEEDYFTIVTDNYSNWWIEYKENTHAMPDGIVRAINMQMIGVGFHSILMEVFK